MPKTPSQIRQAELAKWRRQVIADMRDLIALLRTTTDDEFPTPDVYLSVYSVNTPRDDDIYHTDRLTHEHVRRAMDASPGNWHKYVTSDYTTYHKAFGDTIRIRLEVSRGTTCRRIKTGTVMVDAVEAHEEDVFEWQCDEPEQTVTLDTSDHYPSTEGV